MARLGTRTPGGRTFDIHQGDFRVDERAVSVGARLLARAALLAGTSTQVREHAAKVPERATQASSDGVGNVPNP